MKLRARLRAYSKLSTKEITGLPTVTEADAGSFIGVDASGNYTVFKNATEEDIESMFSDSTNEKTNEIDSWF